MAAISLHATDNDPVLRSRDDETLQPPVKSKPIVRVRSPQPADIATIPRDSNEHDTEIVPGIATGDISKTENIMVDNQIDDKTTTSDTVRDNDSGDEKDESDGDAEAGEEGSGNRKKKSQRFFCTGYPPCNLSFTRSEHLARHIRKHTGERPFQCHCNRRFSRLDNLRQHAQTVHVNEEIPTDSLAATGTRYQRQIRTDRVRPAPRPRTSTMSSSGSHSRGHSRNLSTSSIASTSSVFSNATDVRRRPPPLLMAGENRPTTPPTYSSYAAQSPAELTTPASATFPVTPGSPNFSSVLGSPVSNTPRTAGYTGNSVHVRRLSVPSSGNPYQAPYTQQYGASYGPGPAVQTPNSPQNVTSPTLSTFVNSSNVAMSMNEDWRRRTWHPSSYSNVNVNYNRPATSGLSYSQTPDAPQPAYAQNAMTAAGSAPRLPGIESFDQMQHRPMTPPRRLSPPKSQQPSLMAAPDIESGKRGHRSHTSWDGSRRSLYPEIDDNGRPATNWGRDTLQQIEEQRERTMNRYPGTQSAMGPPQSTNMNVHSQQIAQEALELQSSASKRVKRSGHYSGSQSALRTSPEDSSSSEGIPTPGTSAAEIHPTIMHSNGFIEPQLLAGDPQQTPCLAAPLPFPHPEGRYTHVQTRQDIQQSTRGASSLDRLEALVAVATGSSR